MGAGVVGLSVVVERKSKEEKVEVSKEEGELVVVDE